MADGDNAINAFKIDMLGNNSLAGNSTRIANSNGYWNSDTPLGINVGSPIAANTDVYKVAAPSVEAPTLPNAYSTELPNSVAINNGATTPGFMDWMGTDSAKNTIGLGGLAMTGFGAINSYRAGQQAKKQWEAENARANEIMGMNREKYATYKADKERLNAGYSGGLAASGGVKNG